MNATNTTPPTMTPEEYLKTRVDDQITWYDRKSGINKRWHERIQILTILLGVLIPLFIGYSENQGLESLKDWAGLFGALIAFLEGIRGVKKYKENWATYRMTAEALLREKLLFLNRVSNDPATSADYDFKIFVANCERIMSAENASWRTLFGAEEGTRRGSNSGN